MPVEDYEVTIGLEVHAQLKTQSKMFCACPARYGEPPNTLTCPVCLGMPGALPVLNQGAIERTILTGLMLGCSTPPISKWDRKNYFYPDMPKNYQLSQFDLPLCIGGGVPLYELAYPKDAQKSIKNPGKVVKLTRIHLEEDVAKSTHHEQTSTIDFNRAGTPLMEIVSDPDIETAEEAVAYLNSLRQILIYGDVSDADMEKGQMRCDVNISVRKPGQAELGEKIELKNLNSVSAVRRSIHYEIERQCSELDRGIPQIQSTRRWDDTLAETQLMRTKEDAHDYRYFPDPDLLPVRTPHLVEKMRPLVPELPHEKEARFESSFGISAYASSVLASEQALAAYFEAAAKDAKSPKVVANWVINNLLSVLKENEKTIHKCPLPPEAMRELTDLIESGALSGNLAKEEVFPEMFTTGKSAAVIIKEKGLEPLADTGELEAFCDQVIADNASVVEDVKSGNEKAINFLKGQVMKLSKGKANPKAVGEMLEKKLLG
ncbi:MAG: Asp-tRNA(Asn)/Glu-tRNA(Gln) amidotransferase subunit GatB [Verrucomicrobiales bacterium]